MLTYRLSTKLAEQLKWFDRYRADYDGVLVQSDELFDPLRNFYYIASDDQGHEVGFIHINDKSTLIGAPALNLTDGYVNKTYRGKGYLHQMIKNAVEVFGVEMTYMQTARFERDIAFYESLGFTYYYTVQNAAMVWAFRGNLIDVVKQLNRHP